MTVARDYTFSEGEVKKWCRQAQDHNPLHLSAQAADDHPIFEERIVPGMMFLDRVSGLLTQWGETKDGSVILTNMNHVEFHKPVGFDQEVTITLEESENHDDGYSFWFYVEDEDTGYASGKVYVKVA